MFRSPEAVELSLSDVRARVRASTARSIAGAERPSRNTSSGTGVGAIESACTCWKRTLYRIFKIASVDGGHLEVCPSSSATFSSETSMEEEINREGIAEAACVGYREELCIVVAARQATLEEVRCGRRA